MIPQKIHYTERTPGEIANRVFEIIQYNNETNIYLTLGYITYGKVAKFGNNVILL